MIARCPDCGTGFDCAADRCHEAEATPCWCARFPPLAEPVAGSGCYCPNCLARRVGNTPAPKGDGALC